MKLRVWWLVVKSTRVLILERGKLSLGHALLILVKSTHILHFSFSFCIITTFASHSGHWIPLMNQVLSSFLTSSVMAWFLSGVKLLFFCLTGFVVGLTWSRCITSRGSIPGMSSYVQVNTSWLSIKKLYNYFLDSSNRSDPIRVTRLGYLTSRMTSSSSPLGSITVYVLLSWTFELSIGIASFGAGSPLREAT